MSITGTNAAPSPERQKSFEKTHMADIPTYTPFEEVESVERGLIEAKCIQCFKMSSSMLFFGPTFMTHKSVEFLAYQPLKGHNIVQLVITDTSHAFNPNLEGTLKAIKCPISISGKKPIGVIAADGLKVVDENFLKIQKEKNFEEIKWSLEDEEQACFLAASDSSCFILSQKNLVEYMSKDGEIHLKRNSLNDFKITAFAVNKNNLFFGSGKELLIVKRDTGFTKLSLSNATKKEIGLKEVGDILHLCTTFDSSNQVVATYSNSVYLWEKRNENWVYRKVCIDKAKFTRTHNDLIFVVTHDNTVKIYRNTQTNPFPFLKELKHVNNFPIVELNVSRTEYDIAEDGLSYLAIRLEETKETNNTKIKDSKIKLSKKIKGKTIDPLMNIGGYRTEIYKLKETSV